MSLRPVFIPFLLLPVLTCLAFGRQPGISREAKFNLILRHQDTRVMNSDSLRFLLSDPEPAIRERAALAFGSLQDSTALALLVERLGDPDGRVGTAAAFAIGQTAMQLHETRRLALEAVILARLGGLRSEVRDRMVEEAGKFFSPGGIEQLVVHADTSGPCDSALVFALARSGIRAVTSPAGTRYLVRLCERVSGPPWPVLYALQRIGRNPVVAAHLPGLTALGTSGDPLIRMNLAVLLGKQRDEAMGLPVLMHLASDDPDWRVKVNAIRAIGSYGIRGRDSIAVLFRKLIGNSNTHVASTALSVLSTSGLRSDSTMSRAFLDLADDCRSLTGEAGPGMAWSKRSGASAALAGMRGEKDEMLIESLYRSIDTMPLAPDSVRFFREDVIGALGAAGGPSAAALLLGNCRSVPPRDPLASIDALRAIVGAHPDDTLLTAAVGDLARDFLSLSDVALLTTAASVLGDSAFLNHRSVAPLMITLDRLRFPEDVEAIQEIIATLGKLRAVEAVSRLEQELRNGPPAVVPACRAALAAITGTDPRPQPSVQALPAFIDADYDYLRRLHDTLQMQLQTNRGVITMELYPRRAPFTVMSFVKLASEKHFFRNLVFHRVVPNFVIQGGDPRGDGWGGPGYALRSEFSPLRYETGTVGIASAGKDTEGSQFFITHSPQPHLDGRYTIVGKVVSGMDVVDSIQRGDIILDCIVVP